MPLRSLTGRASLRTGVRDWELAMGAAAVHPPASRSAASLVEQARAMLRDAAAAGEIGERFRLAHLAALRGTAALFAQRARPAGKRRLVSAWVLVDAVAPELAE